jgi:hypothetical protein
MATPEPVAASIRLVAAAIAERRRLLRELARLEQRVEELRHDLARYDGRGEELRRRIELLNELADDADQEPLLEVVEGEASDVPRPPPPLGYLRGAGIRAAAVRVLTQSRSSRSPIHYSRWYELVREAGYGISGQDPQAVFLTQINRSPVVMRTAEPGTYVLDYEAPDRLREQLLSLHQELAHLHEQQETLEGFTSTRDRRAELSASYERVERDLDEATETLSLTQFGNDFE